MTFSKKNQTRGKKEKPISKAKYRDKVHAILNKAWEIQSKGLRTLGYCVGCKENKYPLNAGHLIHHGKGKKHTGHIDFNVCLPVPNIFSQCSYCNCGKMNPDGNGLLRGHFHSLGYNNDDYDNLRLIKNTHREIDTIEEAEWILEETKKRYE
jgi:hypothetical protein